MKKLFALTGLVALFGAALTGCGNTANGVEKDATNAGQAVEKGVQKTGEAVEKGVQKTGEAVEKGAATVADATKDVAKDASGAMVVTPMVKSAILKDTDLGNLDKNSIDVDSADGMVHLKGHVASNELKKKATQIAEATLKENKSTDKVVNELTVEKH